MTVKLCQALEARGSIVCCVNKKAFCVVLSEDLEMNSPSG